MAEDFSNEGLYRLIERMDRVHGQDLKEIRHQTTVTNGRVNRAEQKLIDHDREFKEIKQSLRVPAVAVVDGTRTSSPDDPATVSLSISPKMWGVLAGVSGVFSLLIPTLLKLLEKLFGL